MIIRSWLHDLLLAMYCSCLLVWVEESRPFALSTKERYLYLLHPRATSVSWSDIAFFYVALLLVPAVAVFLVLQFARYSSRRASMRVGCGFIAFAGFPIACLLREKSPLLLAELIIVTAATCLVMWAAQKMVISKTLWSLLLAVYFLLCATLAGGGGVLTKPWARWGIWDYAWFIYPVLGVCYAVVWARYFAVGGIKRDSVQSTVALL